MTLYQCKILCDGVEIATACPADSMTVATLNAMSLEETLRDAVPMLRLRNLTIDDATPMGAP